LDASDFSGEGGSVGYGKYLSCNLTNDATNLIATVSYNGSEAKTLYIPYVK